MVLLIMLLTQLVTYFENENCNFFPFSPKGPDYVSEAES